MIRRWSLLPVIGLLCLTSACKQPEAPDTRAADERAIRDLETEWPKAIAAKDVERFVSFYADDATVFDPNVPAVTGKEAIRADATKFLATPGISMSEQTVKVEVARSGDLAYSHGTFTMSMEGPKKKPITVKGKYVTVYKKQPDGKWKAVADIWNSDLPAAPPAK
jgi:uncharacterized protein (TIGR02246 family)